MRFGILGPLAVWTTDGRSVTIPGVKVRALLADLLLHEGRPVPADRLIDDLWGEDPPANPAGTLQVRVSQLRRALEDAEPGGRELVAHHPAGYLLKADTDADGFRSLVAEAGRTSDPRTRAALLTDALALWRGPALADFADEPFTGPTVARLHEELLTAHEDHAETRLTLGEHARLAAELGDLLTRHPLRERLRAAHMRALYRSGRQTEALRSYEELRDHLADELGLTPGADLGALHRAILTQDPALDPPAPPTSAAGPATNLPTPLTPLIGRDHAATELRALLGANRLVTLTGPGGVGKTRLAVKVAGHLTGPSPESPAVPFPDGVWLVELASLDRSGASDAVSRLAETIMTVLDIRAPLAPSEPMSPRDRLTGALSSRRLLLVLDNCEHLVEPAAELVRHLLEAIPALRILATSQEPLALTGEVIWNVPPLDTPRLTETDLPTLRKTGSVQLFVARASAAGRDFTLDADTAPAVATLCRRLDGIPLALELAATRVRALGVHNLVDRLDDRFRLLAGGHRGAPPRQQTLHAMIDWSWELLTHPERLTLQRLAVHTGDCTLHAAENVCAAEDLASADVPDLLARLVDRSLVTVVHTADGPRYRLLESVAAYCAEHLRRTGELERLRQRHRHHYTDLAEQAAPHLYGHRQQRWLHRLDTETANIRTALDTALGAKDAAGALRLVNAMAWYWLLRGRLTEARRSLASALALADEASVSRTSALRAGALAWETGIGFLHGDVADREDRRRAALSMYEDAGDPAGRARAEWFLAHTGIDLGDLSVAEDLLDQALPAFQAADDRWGTAAALATRAKLAHVRGDLAALGRDGERSAELFGELGDRWGRLEATGWLGALAEMTGDLQRADRLHRDGLRMAEELGLWPEVAGRLAWLGWTALQRGDYAQARETCERALRLAAEQGHRTAQIFATMGLAFAARREDLLDLAETHLRDLLNGAPEQSAEETPPPYLPMIMSELGFVAEQRGDAAAALASHLKSIDLAARFESSREMPGTLEGLAGALTLAGDHDGAALLLGAGSAARASNSPPPPTERGDIDRITTRVREALGADRFTAGFERGGTLTSQEIRSLLAPPPATPETAAARPHPE
ncbi:BTAD domain-containing putative transcriptional regulator [Streptosporangium sp. NPDC002544]|uniref:BTAD domain-containing putative transcriptional regulator n=1 Tax=Streptosporangium sp. NPDC002544 TaxID=3154538 RepID=UPI00331B6EEB